MNRPTVATLAATLSIAAGERAIRLNPLGRFSSIICDNFSEAYWELGDYEAGLRAAQRGAAGGGAGVSEEPRRSSAHAAALSRQSLYWRGAPGRKEPRALSR